MAAQNDRRDLRYGQPVWVLYSKPAKRRIDRGRIVRFLVLLLYPLIVLGCMGMAVATNDDRWFWAVCVVLVPVLIVGVIGIVYGLWSLAEEWH